MLAFLLTDVIGWPRRTALAAHDQRYVTLLHHDTSQHETGHAPKGLAAHGWSCAGATRGAQNASDSMTLMTYAVASHGAEIAERDEGYVALLEKILRGGQGEELDLMPSVPHRALHGLKRGDVTATIGNEKELRQRQLG
jgi:hypothetical protein